jgi:hypothetical protein
VLWNLDRHRFDAEDPTFHFDADTDPDPHPDPIPSFTHVRNHIFLYFFWFTGMPVYIFHHFLQCKMCHNLQYFGQHIEIFMKKDCLSLHLVEMNEQKDADPTGS